MLASNREVAWTSLCLKWEVRLQQDHHRGAAVADMKEVYHLYPSAVTTSSLFAAVNEPKFFVPKVLRHVVF